MTDTDTREVTLATGDAALPGLLGVPEDPVGLVLFAHGSGSRRFSGRNQAVARALQDGRAGHTAVRSAHRARG